VNDDRITWLRGKRRPGPRQTIGVLELRGDGACRAVFAERAEVDGRCHIRLARLAWGPKDALDTRWWSLVVGPDRQVHTVRNGSCGDALTTAEVPRIVRALEDLGLANPGIMLAVDDGPAVMPWRAPRAPSPPVGL
jgi:hypothetical protein